ncbi:alpha/beta fold hydrolase [Thiohalocapsa halophila]
MAARAMAGRFRRQSPADSRWRPLRHHSVRLPGLGRVTISHRPPPTARTPAADQGPAGAPRNPRDRTHWIIFSPGALTRAKDYPELLDALTAAGAAVLTLDYDWPKLFAGDAAELAKPTRAAGRLERGELPARGLARHGLPAPLPRRRGRQAPPLRILGYSLGGWVLSAGFAEHRHGQPLEIGLLGASTLREPWQPPSRRRQRVRLLAGTEDGVIDPKALEQLAASFATDVEWLDGVSHFGLLADAVGAADFRARDRTTGLTRRQCAERIARQLLHAPEPA